jgi:hypothetical protein
MLFDCKFVSGAMVVLEGIEIVTQQQAGLLKRSKDRPI